MSDWVQVVLDDLSTMAKTFGDETKTYEGLVPKFLPAAAVDSGDDSLNKTMKAALDRLAVLQHQMTRNLQIHAQKLSYAHDSYQRHDIDNRELFDDLTKGLD